MAGRKVVLLFKLHIIIIIELKRKKEEHVTGAPNFSIFLSQFMGFFYREEFQHEFSKVSRQVYMYNADRTFCYLENLNELKVPLMHLVLLLLIEEL